MSEQSNSKRIAKNTLMLYFRQILIMLVSLYTVRVVLNVLGTEDYGIHNVVAGVVTMFSFLANSMATASQRYFSFDLGKNDYEKLKTTFSVIIEIYVLLILVVIIFAETFGLWFVNNKLIIPENRLLAANFIYQCAIISFLFTLITTPYMAVIIAHEQMNVYAYVSVVEVILKLGIVFLLRIISIDKLMLYGFLLTVISILNTSVYRIYCRKHYEECKFKFVKDKFLFKELISYSSWNLFGSSISVVKNQIMNILLNIFFGPIVNAARGIASQVSSAVTSFSQNFSTALRPQVIKAYAAKDKQQCMAMVYRGSKFTFFLMMFFAIPLELEMRYVLTLWLKNPPEIAILFTRLVLIDCLIDSLNYQIMTLAQATGKIKLYQSIVGGILLCNLPISYIFLKLGAPPYTVLLVSIVLTIIAAITRLFIVKRITDFSILGFFKFVILPCFFILILAYASTFWIVYIIPQSFIRLLLSVLLSSVFIFIYVYILGVSKAERAEIIKYIKTKLHFLHK